MEETNQSTLKALADAVILIPSLEPDERLPAYIAKLYNSYLERQKEKEDFSEDETV